MKTYKLSLALAFALLTSLCGCEEMDLSGFGSTGGGDGGSNIGLFYSESYKPSFYIDSTAQASNSKLIVWAHIQYDSILIIKWRQTRSIEVGGRNPPEVISNIQTQQQSIDFRLLADSVRDSTGRMEGIYKYKFELENLKQDVDYSVCLYHDYVDRIGRFTNEQCVPVRLN